MLRKGCCVLYFPSAVSSKEQLYALPHETVQRISDMRVVRCSNRNRIEAANPTIMPRLLSLYWTMDNKSIATADYMWYTFNFSRRPLTRPHLTNGAFMLSLLGHATVAVTADDEDMLRKVLLHATLYVQSLGRASEGDYWSAIERLRNSYLLQGPEGAVTWGKLLSYSLNSFPTRTFYLLMRPFGARLGYVKLPLVYTETVELRNAEEVIKYYAEAPYSATYLGSPHTMLSNQATYMRAAVEAGNETAVNLILQIYAAANEEVDGIETLVQLAALRGLHGILKALLSTKHSPPSLATTFYRTTWSFVSDRSTARILASSWPPDHSVLCCVPTVEVSRCLIDDGLLCPPSKAWYLQQPLEFSLEPCNEDAGDVWTTDNFGHSMDVMLYLAKHPSMANQKQFFAILNACQTDNIWKVRALVYAKFTLPMLTSGYVINSYNHPSLRYLSSNYVHQILELEDRGCPNWLLFAEEIMQSSHVRPIDVTFVTHWIKNVSDSDRVLHLLALLLTDSLFAAKPGVRAFMRSYYQSLDTADLCYLRPQMDTLLNNIRNLDNNNND